MCKYQIRKSKRSWLPKDSRLQRHLVGKWGQRLFKGWLFQRVLNHYYWEIKKKKYFPWLELWVGNIMVTKEVCKHVTHRKLNLVWNELPLELEAGWLHEHGSEPRLISPAENMWTWLFGFRDLAGAAERESRTLPGQLQGLWGEINYPHNAETPIMITGKLSLVTAKAWLDYIQDKKNLTSAHQQPCGKARGDSGLGAAEE